MATSTVAAAMAGGRVATAVSSTGATTPAAAAIVRKEEEEGKNILFQNKRFDLESINRRFLGNNEKYDNFFGVREKK